MAKGKNVLTTGDVAKICNVAPRTVSKWFDNGQLKGYRIPGSKDRRIPVTELLRFMKLHNMPTDALVAGNTRVLIVGMDEDRALALAEVLRHKANYEVQAVQTDFETGMAAHKFAPHVMLLNLLNGNVDTVKICNSIRDDEELQATKILAVTSNLSESEQHALLKNGFDGCVDTEASPDEIIRAIERATAIVY